jgi:hypothetical protein
MIAAAAEGPSSGTMRLNAGTAQPLPTGDGPPWRAEAPDRWHECESTDTKTQRHTVPVLERAGDTEAQDREPC